MRDNSTFKLSRRDTGRVSHKCNRLVPSVDHRTRCEESLHGMHVGIARRLLHEVVGMNELVPEPRIMVWIEYASHPIDDLADALGFPDVGMIGQPDIE